MRKILAVTIAVALVLGGVGTAALLTDSATGGVAWSTTAKTTTGTTTTGGATTTVTVTLPTTVAVTTTGPSQTVTVTGPSTTVTTPGQTKVVKRKTGVAGVKVRVVSHRAPKATG